MELESLQFDKSSYARASAPELNALDLMKGASNDKTFPSTERRALSSDNLVLLPKDLDFSVPLDGSKAKAPPEFLSLTPNSGKTGVDGVMETIKDKLSGVFGERVTLHDHVRLLARAGMTPSERQQLAKEEQQLKAHLKTDSDNPLIKYTLEMERPKTPMLDELNRRTTALEKNISETAKKNMTPLQIAQLESGTASLALKAQYENQLVATVAQYDLNGSVPKEVYSAVVVAARKEKILEEQQAGKDQKALDKLVSGQGTLPQISIIFDEEPIRPYGGGRRDEPVIVGRPYNGEEPWVVGNRPRRFDFADKR
ncbi:hypothetical protein KBI23_20710 [bacterium]|nr:hypothetical protein [bacterium]MBP9809928.1 hypothetical protein [bacterium]